MDFNKLIKQFSSNDVLDVLASSVGGDKKDVGKAAALGLPAIMEALNRNTNTDEGAQALTKALESHKGADTSNIAGLLKNVDMEDGAKIIGHVFGDKSESVAKSISKKTGLDTGQIGKLLVQFAPVILDFLGDEKEKKGLDAGGISGLTSTLSGLFGKGGGGGSGSFGKNAGSLLSIASSFLDDGDDEDDGGQDLLGALGGLFS